MARSKAQWLNKARVAVFPGIFAVTVLAATSANAADVVGKWYGRLDSEPVININKTGAEYSASLDYPDTTQTVLRGSRTSHETIHKEITSFKVAGGNVRFSIGNLDSENGDTNYERDEYNLNLSGDGLQLIGTVSRLVSYQDASRPSMTATPITMFPTDWTSRNTKSQP
jgi:hypothetical protein